MRPWSALAFCALLLAVVPPAGSVELEWAVAVFPSGAEFQLEIAADEVTRARGYMFREEVGAREGMLFLFAESDFHGFWMKNCLVDLDIIWLDERSRVVEIAHSLPPCGPEQPCPTVAPMRAAYRVLEVAGGTCRAEGLEVGDRVEILSEPPLP